VPTLKINHLQGFSRVSGFSFSLYPIPNV
jgi:hypothetical protein